MSKTHQIFTRYTALFFILILGIVTIGGCSSGDGDSGTAPPVVPSEPSLLPLYDLSIIGVSGGITAEVDEGGTNHAIRINPTTEGGAGMAATLNCDVTTENCEIGSIKVGSRIDIYDEGGTLFGDFTIQVTEALNLLGSEKPTAGSIQITSGEDTITLNITTCNTVPGVEILLNDTVLGCYPWADFENLDENSVVPAEQMAVFALDMIDFIFYQANFANNSFDIIGESIGSATSSVDLDCAAFSDRNYSVGTGIVDQGLFTFSWVDDNSDGVVSSGDGFSLNFNNCWFGDIEDIDIYNGIINLNAYTLVINSENVITRLGFEGNTGNTGGVFFSGFAMDEALVNGNSVVLSGTTISLSGGFTIVYSQPVP